MPSARRCSSSADWPDSSCGAPRGEHAALIRALGATPIDYRREDFTRLLLRGFDVVFDGIGANGNPRSLAALKRVGLLCACCYSAGAQARRRFSPC